MRILHLADTHLGYSAYTKVSASGLNQRELDIYQAFKQIIDFALNPPDGKPIDLVLHSGDLFDSVRPTNRAIAWTLNQLLRLSRAGIRVVVISGNHETPKLKETGHVFRLFEHLPNIFPIYKGEYEQLRFSNQGEEVLIHAIPHCSTQAALKGNLEKLAPEQGVSNLLLLHGGVIGLKEFRKGDFNEQLIPTRYLSNKWDYIALGHYHKHVEVQPNAYYSGSTERFSFAEALNEPGFIDLQLKDGKPSKRFIPLKSRPMLTQEIECKGLEPLAINRLIEQRLKEIGWKGKILRFGLNNISRESYRAMDFNQLKRLSPDALYLELKPQMEARLGEIKSAKAIGLLHDELLAYMDQLAIEQKDKSILKEIALKYLAEAME
jgi:DNA repair exonuclease SbcCD nuclease subunit